MEQSVDGLQAVSECSANGTGSTWLMYPSAAVDCCPCCWPRVVQLDKGFRHCVELLQKDHLPVSREFKKCCEWARPGVFGKDFLILPVNREYVLILVY